MLKDYTVVNSFTPPPQKCFQCEPVSFIHCTSSHTLVTKRLLKQILKMLLYYPYQTSVRQKWFYCKDIFTEKEQTSSITCMTNTK